MVAAAPHLLLVDDDPALRELVADYLRDHDLRVSVAADGQGLRAAVEQEAFDLVLLDRRLPGEDGLALIQALRGQLPELPIILLTGRSEEADRVMGLELGADDYITKPFSQRELLARVRAVLRRSRRGQGEAADALPPPAHGLREGSLRAYRFGGWELNLRTRRLQAPDGRRLELSNGEFSLLAAFCQAPDRVLSRDQLLGLSRLHEGEVYDRSIDVQILRLRRKIEPEPSRPQWIVTERGAGYRLAAQVQAL